MSAARWIVVLVAAAAAVAAAIAIFGQASSGAQPWGSELSDNFVFAKSIPFTLGLAIAVGVLWPRGAFAGRVFAAGLACALPTGVWQYLGGILSQDQLVPGASTLLDAASPIPVYVFYRIHYIGATLVLFATTSIATGWWVDGPRTIWGPPWAGDLAALLKALPRLLRIAVAQRLGLKTELPAAGTPELTYYHKIVTFPAWEFTIALITITGLVKALRYVLPVPGLVLFFMSTLHVTAMALILIQLLDQLRYNLGRWRARTLLAAGAILWCVANIGLGYFFVTSAFVAKTAVKDGPLAQASLLLSGLVVEALALFLLWRSGRIILGRDAGGR